MITLVFLGFMAMVGLIGAVVIANEVATRRMEQQAARVQSPFHFRDKC